ncbi:MAG TPA: hypothetical protein VF590_01270, partial [Isosphaeraceae bacterium]
ALAFGRPLPAWPLDHFRQMDWLAPPAGDVVGCEVRGQYAQVLDNLVQLGFAAGAEPTVPGVGVVPAAGPGLATSVCDGLSLRA